MLTYYISMLTVETQHYSASHPSATGPDLTLFCLITHEKQGASSVQCRTHEIVRRWWEMCAFPRGWAINASCPAQQQIQEAPPSASRSCCAADFSPFFSFLLLHPGVSQSGWELKVSWFHRNSTVNLFQIESPRKKRIRFLINGISFLQSN